MFSTKATTVIKENFQIEITTVLSKIQPFPIGIFKRKLILDKYNFYFHEDTSEGQHGPF